MTEQTPDPSGDAGRGAVLGPFGVRASRPEVEVFRGAIGGGGRGIPFTFPIRWLAEPSVRAALAKTLSVGDEIPVHEGQSFEYERPLDLDTDYVMTLYALRTSAPERLVVRADVADAARTVHVRMEMVLRLIGRDGSAA